MGKIVAWQLVFAQKVSLDFKTFEIILIKCFFFVLHFRSLCLSLALPLSFSKNKK